MRLPHSMNSINENERYMCVHSRKDTWSPSSHSCEDPWSPVPGWIDGVATVETKGHTNHRHDQPHTQRHHSSGWLHVVFVCYGQHHTQQQSSCQDLKTKLKWLDNIPWERMRSRRTDLVSQSNVAGQEGFGVRCPDAGCPIWSDHLADASVESIQSIWRENKV